MYRLRYRISITDALTCKQPFNVAAGGGYKLSVFCVARTILISHIGAGKGTRLASCIVKGNKNG